MRIQSEIRTGYKLSNRPADNNSPLPPPSTRAITSNSSITLFSTMVLPHEPEFEQVRTKINASQLKLTQSSLGPP